ncbi:MAG: hypothetical protein AABX34_06235 [Nanoarchaeota archaeon]
MRKSQAALEFLTTYSWAFLVIIIMVGALAYFGVLSPSKLLPDRCNFGSEVGCNKDFMVVNNVNDNTLTLRLENDFGGPVTVTTATTVTIDVVAAGACTPQIGTTIATLANIPVGGFTWNSDATIIFAADCAAGTALVEKEKVKFTIELVYFPVASGSTYTKRVFGEVFTTIQ